MCRVLPSPLAREILHTLVPYCPISYVIRYMYMYIYTSQKYSKTIPGKDNPLRNETEKEKTYYEDLVGQNNNYISTVYCGFRCTDNLKHSVANIMLTVQVIILASKLVFQTLIFSPDECMLSYIQNMLASNSNVKLDKINATLK